MLISNDYLVCVLVSSNHKRSPIMFGPLFRSTVGRIVFQSMQRRHVLWGAINAATALVLYAIIKVFGRGFSFLFGVHIQSFCILEFAVHMLSYAALSALVYGAYTSDVGEFGGTAIRTCLLTKTMLTQCARIFVAAFFGKSILTVLDIHTITIGTIFDYSSGDILLPMLACFFTLQSYFNHSASQSTLQDKPQPVLRSFGAAALHAAKQAVPRSLFLAVALSVVLIALRGAERTYFNLQCPSLTFTKTWTLSTVFICEGFHSEAVFLSKYLPNTSVWSDVAVCFVAAAVLLFQTELLMSSLAFVTTYPLNFQKLKAQLTQGEPVSIADNNEVLIVQALLIGTDGTSATGSTAPVQSSSVNYANSTMQNEVAVHAARQAALTQAVRCKSFEPSVVAYFGEAGSPASTGGHTFSKNATHTGDTKVCPFDLLARSLAFQDLYRVATCKPLRRAVLYEKHWPQVVTATLTMIDAAALQMNLLDDFMTKPTASMPAANRESATTAAVPLAPTRAAPVSALASTNTASAAMGQRSGTSFEDIVKLRERLAQQTAPSSASNPTNSTTTEIEVKPFAPSADNGNSRSSRSLLSSALGAVQAVQKENKVLGQVLESLFLGMCAYWRVPVPGYGADCAGNLPMQALPPMCTSTVTLAVQSVTALLVHALAEDKTGFTQRSVCPVVASLLGLESSLVAYCGTLQASQCVSISAKGRTQQIRYRARSENAVPAGVRVLLAALREGLAQVLRAYRDVLVRVVAHYDAAAQQTGAFSREQMIVPEAKLLEVGDSK